MVAVAIIILVYLPVLALEGVPARCSGRWR